MTMKGNANLAAHIFSRESFLIIGTLFFTVSPFLVIVFYAAAAIATLTRWRQIKVDKESIATGIVIICISAWMFYRKTIPEDYQPGRVALTDYVPLFHFFYIISLIPFSDSENENIAYALMTTVPQQFILGFAEKYCNWYGPIQYFLRNNAIIDIFVGSYDHGKAVSATLYNPNILAVYGAICIAVSIGLLLNEADKIIGNGKYALTIWIRIIFISVCLALCLTLMVWTNSRNGWIAVVWITLCYAITRKRLRLLRIVGAVMIALTLLVSLNLGFVTKAAKYAIPSGIAGRFIHSVEKSFFEGRVDVYECAAQLIKERPLEGWGLGRLTTECTRRNGHYVCHAHNLFLQLAAEIGLPFAVIAGCLFGIIYIKLMIDFLKKLVKENISNLDLALFIAVTTTLLMQVFDLALLMTYRLNFLFWLCFAILYSRAQRVSYTAGRSA